MTLLEWILIAQAMLLAVALVMFVIGLCLSYGNAADPTYRFFSLFWAGFLQRPAEFDRAFTSTGQLFMPRGRRKAALVEAGAGGEVEGEAVLASRGKRSVAGSSPRGKRVMPTATIPVKVVPGASQNQVVGILGDSLKIQVMAPPEGGKANRAVLELLADSLGIKANQLRIVGGHYQANKRVQVDGLDQVTVNDRLGLK